MDISRLIIGIWLALFGMTAFSQVSGIVSDEEGNPLQAMVFAEGTNKSTYANGKGEYQLNLSSGSYQLVAFVPGFQSGIHEVSVSGAVEINFVLRELTEELESVTVEGSRSEDLGISWLQSVEGAAIYEAKKTELINLDDVVGNVATNSSRQVYARVPGLNIFENDGVGLQLAIGARGLDPNRTSNFNVRQNGYDISADALGYPESYYTPPVQALDRIEIVRGAAGLQYGSQFGGLLNFKFKEGPEDRPIEFLTSNTAGSFGLFSTFNSVGGTVGKVNYYGFYQYKTADGWRPNSEVDQHTAFGSAKYQFTPFIDVKVEFTHMNYLAHQPGGLTDAQFDQDSGQSNRNRNWFQVGWNLGAVQWNYRINQKWKINNRTFFLKANRYAVGNLERIDRLDDESENRNLLKDDYQNWGNEIRVIYHYDLFGQKSILLFGNRYYEGLTESGQGAGSSDSDADFNYQNPGMPENSSFEFPSKNLSFFVENIFNLSEKLSLTPGFRYESILTEADGYYINRSFDFAGNVLSEETVLETRDDARDFVLLGLGASYKLGDRSELYSNFSQNYRGINFTDIRVDNPSLQVDSLIADESGFNIDLGIRGSKEDVYQYDASVFYLSYQDRIGNALITVPDPNFGGIIDRVITYRTNIGDAYIFGFEGYGEYNLTKGFGWSDQLGAFKLFLNLAVIESEYLKIDERVREGVEEGNEVELVPNINLKTGLKYKKENLQGSLLFSYVGDQFSDAANTDPAAPTAIQGVVPAYQVVDFSADYTYKQWKFGAGINNLLDEKYFTRRATGYPGPGIIPSAPRSYYVTLQFKL